MPVIENYICTSKPHTFPYVQIDDSLGSPNAFTDTFICNSSIFFGVNHNFLGKLLQLPSIPPINNFINNRKLVVFLCESIDGSGTFTNVHSFEIFSFQRRTSTSNYYNTDITNIFSNFSNNEKLLENMSTTEIQKLKKTFKLIFRVVLNTNINTTPELQSKDIIQDIHLVLDTNESGPYDVNFENIDILSPNDFTDVERKSAYSKNLTMLGFEGIRCFYPKNINDLGSIPVVYGIRANAGSIEQYDIYMSLFASYGYFCMSSFYDVTSHSTTIFDGGIYGITLPIEFNKNISYSENLLSSMGANVSTQNGIGNIGYLDHIKTNLNKISGGKFNNKLDFTKIILFGHSRGGGAILSMAELLSYKGISGSLIQKYNTGITLTDIKALICLAPAKQDILQSNGSISCIGGLQTTEENLTNIVPALSSTVFIGITSHRFMTYQSGISQAQTALITGANVNSLKLNVNIPTLLIASEFDFDVGQNPLTLFKCLNNDVSGNITARKKIITIKKQGHNGVASPIKLQSSYNGLLNNEYYDTKSSDQFIYSNITSRSLLLAAKAMEFIAENVYSTTLNTELLSNFNDFSERNKKLYSCLQITEHGLSSGIKLKIDDFSNPGITFNFGLISGYTLDYSISSRIKNQLNELSDPGYTLANDHYSKGLILYEDNPYFAYRLNLPQSDYFSVYTSSGKGILFLNNGQGITTNSSAIEYNFSTPINLTGCNYIELNCSLINEQRYRVEQPVHIAMVVGSGAGGAIQSSVYSSTYNSGLIAPNIVQNSSNNIDDNVRSFLSIIPELNGLTCHGFSQLQSIKFPIIDILNQGSNIGNFNIEDIRLLQLYFPGLAGYPGITKGSIYIDSIYVR